MTFTQRTSWNALYTKRRQKEMLQKAIKEQHLQQNTHEMDLTSRLTRYERERKHRIHWTIGWTIIGIVCMLGFTAIYWAI